MPRHKCQHSAKRSSGMPLTSIGGRALVHVATEMVRLLLSCISGASVDRTIGEQQVNVEQANIVSQGKGGTQMAHTMGKNASSSEYRVRASSATRASANYRIHHTSEGRFVRRCISLSKTSQQRWQYRVTAIEEIVASRCTYSEFAKVRVEIQDVGIT